MTTIAYSHSKKELAVDSRLTEGSLIVTDKDEKFVRCSRRVFVLCGDYNASNQLVDVYLGRGPKPDKPDLDATAILIENGLVYALNYAEGEIDKWLLDHDSCFGSGGAFALAALDFGRDAKEAVAYAATRDSHTGGKIHVFKVK
jgi:hypothetical protein